MLLAVINVQEMALERKDARRWLWRLRSTRACRRLTSQVGVVFDIVVLRRDVRGRGVQAGARHACEAGWACLKMRDVGRVAVLLVTV